MSNKKTSGIGFFTLLGLLFIGLKLGNVITWSWWLVTLPLWGGIALIVSIVFILIIIKAIIILTLGK